MGAAATSAGGASASITVFESPASEGISAWPAEDGRETSGASDGLVRSIQATAGGGGGATVAGGDHGLGFETSERSGTCIRSVLSTPGGLTGAGGVEGGWGDAGARDASERSGTHITCVFPATGRDSGSGGGPVRGAGGTTWAGGCTRSGTGATGLGMARGGGADEIVADGDDATGGFSRLGTGWASV